MSQFLSEPKSSKRRVKVELDLSNYATKAVFKIEAGVDVHKFAKIVELANSKSDVNKLDINKLKNVPNDLSNLKVKQINQMLINQHLFLLIQVNQMMQ